MSPAIPEGATHFVIFHKAMLHQDFALFTAISVYSKSPFLTCDDAKNMTCCQLLSSSFCLAATRMNSQVESASIELDHLCYSGMPADTFHIIIAAVFANLGIKILTLLLKKASLSRITEDMAFLPRKWPQK